MSIKDLEKEISSLKAKVNELSDQEVYSFRDANKILKRLEKLESQPEEAITHNPCEKPGCLVLHPSQKKECCHQWLAYEWKTPAEMDGTLFLRETESDGLVYDYFTVNKLICGKCGEKKDVA